MIVFNGMDLIGFAIGAALLVICGIIIVFDHIAAAVKKRRQKRLDEVRKKDGQT